MQVGLSSNYPLQTHPSETSACIKYISNWPASSASSKVMRKEVGADRWLGRQYAHMFHFLQILSGNYSKIYEFPTDAQKANLSKTNPAVNNYS